MPSLLQVMDDIDDAYEAGVRALDLFAYDGVTVFVDFDAGHKRDIDYMVGMRDGRLFGLPNRFTWRDLLLVSQDLGSRHQLRLMVGTIWGGLDVHQMAFTGNPSQTHRDDWVALASIVQAISIQEEFNYPDKNGWWWMFHVMRCAALGSPNAVLMRQVGNAWRHLPRAERCDECERCDRRPWSDPPSLGTDLRRHYQAPATLLARHDVLAELLLP